MPNDRLAVLPQYLLPKRAVTRLAGWVASARRDTGPTRLIRWFVARYGVDMSEAAEPDIAAYATFNDFFTRALKPGARPLAQADLVCPVDGAITTTAPRRWSAAMRRWRRCSTTATSPRCT